MLGNGFWQIPRILVDIAIIIDNIPNTLKYNILKISGSEALFSPFPGIIC